jgi:hypothetical protein
MNIISVSSEEEINKLGYKICEESREQMEILFNDKWLRSQVTIDIDILGLCVGVWNNLVGFIEKI